MEAFTKGNEEEILPKDKVLSLSAPGYNDFSRVNHSLLTVSCADQARVLVWTKVAQFMPECPSASGFLSPHTCWVPERQGGGRLCWEALGFPDTKPEPWKILVK